MSQPSVQQHIHAPVNGPVAGRDVHYYEQYVLQRDATLWDWSAEQLRDRLRAVRAERREARMRQWLNWPTFVLGLLMLGLLGVSATMGISLHEFGPLEVREGAVTRDASLGGWSIVFLGVALAIYFVGGRLNQIRRFEAMVVRDTEAEIDTIALVLRRKYGR